MQARYVIRNGELIAKEDAKISVYNKAMFFDFAVYSNIKVVQGKLFMPGLEITKLFESAEMIGIKHELSKDEIISWTKRLVDADGIKDALIRVLLIGAEDETEPTLFLFPVGLTFYKKSMYSKGVKLITYDGQRAFPLAKTKDLLLGYVAYRKAVRNGALDALMVDSDGNAREGTRSSFFVIKGDTLIAPPKEKVLEGITRKIIMDIAPRIMKVKERDIPMAGINGYDEYFISGTTLNIMPVRQINNVIVMEGSGKKTRELQELYKTYTSGHIQG
jgi:branched-chain amino acid aminotransferase